MWHACRISVRRENGMLMGESRTSNGTGKLIAALLSFFLITAGGVVGYAVGSLFGLDIDISYTLGEAVVAVGTIIALGGAAYLRFDRDAIIESWKFMWWIIVLSAILMVWDLYDYVMAGEVVHKGWLLRCLSSLVLCLAIGVAEEGMFRGALFGGLLARFGGTKKGILWCVALSSLAFGCAHVTAEDFDFTKWYTVVQALCKICQTGIYAVMLCAVVLKTKSLVGAMMVHAIDDYLLFVVSTGLFGETFETEYVTTEADEGVSTIVFYLIIIVLYLPTFIKAVRYLMKVEAPQHGPFVKELPQLQPGSEWQAPYVQPYAPQMMPPAQNYPYYGAYDQPQPLASNAEALAQQPLASVQAPQPAQQEYQQWDAQQPYAQPQQAWQQPAWQPQQESAWQQPQQAWQQEPAWQQPQQQPQQAWQQDPSWQQQQAWQQPQAQPWQQQGASRRPPRPDGLA